MNTDSTSTASPVCFHCGEPVPDGFLQSVLFDGARHPVCCGGCQAVMSAIVSAGLGDYYRHRSTAAVSGALPEQLQQKLNEFVVFDEPDVSERFVRRVAAQATDSPGKKNTFGNTGGNRGDHVSVTLAVDDMRCGACVWLLERCMSGMAGVTSASFNYSTARAYIEYDSQQVKLSDLLQRIAQTGYRAVPFDASKSEDQLKKQSRRMLQRVFVAGVAMMQVMMYALPAYLSADGELEFAHQRLLQWASLVLTTPVLVFSAQPFFSGALRDLRAAKPGMDVPVSLGILSAFATSVFATVTGSGEIYFDTVTMFVFLLLLARYLEWNLRAKSQRALIDVASQLPDVAQRLVPESSSSLMSATTETVPASRLIVGDRIRVDSGAVIPVDGRVVYGAGAVSQAVLTGESVPVSVVVGSDIAGGAMVCGSPLVFRVTRPQSNSALSMISQLVDRGAREKPALVSIADRIAGWFVAGLLLFTVAVFMVWLSFDSQRALAIAITVLVVSCPCALSLSTPAALAATTARLLRSRLLVTRGDVIEKLSAVSDIVFDKTGTLTCGSPEIVGLQCPGPESRRQSLLQVAATMESGSAHPFASAIKKFVQVSQTPGQPVESPQLSAVSHCIGAGISAYWQHHGKVRLGSAAYCGLGRSQLKQWHKKTENTSAGSTTLAPASMIYLCLYTPADSSNNTAIPQILMALSVADPLRTDSYDVVKRLQSYGYRLHLLSGDDNQVATQVAQQLGIAHSTGEVSPQGKQRYVTALQQGGARVLMVGDGVNDAPVLATANVSMAVADASALTKTSADLINLAGGLGALLPLLRLSRQTMRVVRQNLLWATLYNITAIPLAAIGVIAPWAAAIGMSLSSLLVAGNAFRLWLTDLSDSQPRLAVPGVCEITRGPKPENSASTVKRPLPAGSL